MFSRNIPDQKVDVGDPLKVKIPFSGKGPFEVKLKKGNREIPENDHIKYTVFDDYIVLNLKGNGMKFIYACVI